MFEVLLIDDEPWVLMGMQRIFNWEKWGFHVSAAVSSSLDGLSLIEKRHIDVVFSDIRMPDLSGLELLEKVHTKNPSIVFILISGFADFCYAQQALRNGAYDYLLKPVDQNTTDAFLEKLSNYMQNIQFNNNTSLFSRLVKGMADIESLFPDTVFSHYQVFSIESERETAALSALPTSCRVSRLTLGRHKSIYFCNTAENLLPYLETDRKPQMNIGLSECTTLFSEKNLVVQAESALKQSFFTGSPGIFIWQPTDFFLIKEISQKIAEISKSGSRSEIIQYFRSLSTDRLKAEDAVFLWNQISLYLQNELSSKKEFHYTDVEQFLYDFKDWNSLLLVLEDMTHPADADEKTASVFNDELFPSMLSYIQEHYTENLYLKDLADHFYLNFTYCCELFKKNAGVTFSRYLTRLRLEKAADLLLNSDASIEDICFSCGYHDYSYFSKAFKKEYSLTPFQYKKEKTL